MADDTKPFHNPFGALAGLTGTSGSAGTPGTAGTAGTPVTASAAGAPVTVKSTTGAKGAKTYARAVVRMERSGRGGKEVTVIEQLELTPAERPVWLAALKGALGCGGSIEDASLMLQGDHRNRLPAILGARGVKKIIVSK